MIRQHSHRVMRQCTKSSSSITTRTMQQYVNNVNNNESTPSSAASAGCISPSNKEVNEKSINDCISKQQQEYITRRLEFEEYSPHNPYTPFALQQQQQQQQYYSAPYFGQQSNCTTYYTQQPLSLHVPYRYPQPLFTAAHYYSTCAASAAAVTEQQQQVQLEIPKSTAIIIKKPSSPSSDSKTKKSSLTTTTKSQLAAQQPTTATKSDAHIAHLEKKAEIEQEKERLKLERQRLSEIRIANNARFKLYLSSLPELDYPSHYKVECASTMNEANTKLDQLIKEDSAKMFGLDLEWPPCFVKGQKENKVSLVQICSAKRILLIQLSRINGIPQELKRFFQDKKLLKSGVNIGSDGLKLQRDFGLITNGLVELRDLAEITTSDKIHITHLRSLRALTGIFMEQHMPKGKVRVSNWAKPDLTPQQIRYAAMDAYASYRLFVILEGLRDTKKPLKIKHLVGEIIPLTKEEKQQKKKMTQQRDHYIHNNKASPTQTVTIIDPNKKMNKSSSSSSPKSNSRSPSPSSSYQNKKKRE